MKTLYYDCFAGISGDMNLAALIDLGADPEKLISELQKLPFGGWEIKIKKDSRGGISGTQLEVVCHEPHHADHHHHGHHHHEHKTFAEIKKMIEDSALSEFVKEKSVAIFKTLADAEGHIHGKSADEVHFHEVGAVDSIIDIVGAAICAEILGVKKFASSAVELGGGTIKCMHGIIPVPAPATAIIAKSFPSKLGGAQHECTTPTGAAIIATLCDSFNPKISGKIFATGIGVGHRDSKELPNVLRVMLIEETETRKSIECESMFVLSANIDDMTGEALALFIDKLFENGAADAWQESIVMKKGRMASKLCALASEGTVDALKDCFFRHSSTLGVRCSKIERCAIERRTESLDTSFGTVRFKVSEFDGIVRSKPEFEDIKRISNEKGLSFSEIESALRNEHKK